MPIPREQWVSRRLEDIVDAIFYVGPASSRTAAGISPVLCADPGYIKMRLERIALTALPPGETDRVKRECHVER